MSSHLAISPASRRARARPSMHCRRTPGEFEHASSSDFPISGYKVDLKRLWRAGRWNAFLQASEPAFERPRHLFPGLHSLSGSGQMMRPGPYILVPSDEWPVYWSLRMVVNDLPALGRNSRRWQKALLKSVQPPYQHPIHRCTSRPLCRTWTNDRPRRSSSYLRPSASALRFCRSRSSATKGDSGLGRGINRSSSRPSRL
jgi:hypothetical protein